MQNKTLEGATFCRFVLNVYFSLFYGSVILSIYAIVTINLQLLAVLAFSIFLQKLLAKRNYSYIQLIKKYVQPKLYFQKFQRIFQQQPPESGCLFSHHPHSVYSLALLINTNFANDNYSKMIPLGSRFILNTPFAGLVLRLWGVQTVNHQNMMALMKTRQNIGLVPGGFQQATITTPKAFRIYIKQRKGFVKLALKNGYKICPVVVLNQHKVFHTFDYFIKFRLFLNKLKMPGVIPFGQFGFFAYPNYDIYTIIGKSIELPKIQKPSKQDVTHWHNIYIKQLEEIYNKYKHLNNNVPLELY